jgi:hypothetical protein
MEAAIATVGAQESGQQFIACEPGSQQVWCAAARGLSAAKAQSARSGAMSANAATDPGRAMTSINMIEKSGRCIGEEYVTGAAYGKYRRKIDNSRTVFQPAMVPRAIETAHCLVCLGIGGWCWRSPDLTPCSFDADRYTSELMAAAALLLDGWAGHRAVRAENATVAGLWLK